MESIEIDIKIWMGWEGGEKEKEVGGAGKKKKRSRPKVTHVPPLMGSVFLNSVCPWSGSQLSSTDQHQHIMSNTIGWGGWLMVMLM